MLNHSYGFEYMENKVLHIQHDNIDSKLNNKAIELSFMYKPIIDSIIQYIRHTTKNIKINYLPNHDFTNIQKEDILLWVGFIGINSPNFTSLRINGTYVIYYNTEPTLFQCDSDETWTYSKLMFHKYSMEYHPIKFIPVALEQTHYHLNYLSSSTLPLVFLGYLSLRLESCRQLFSYDNIKCNLLEVYELWSDHDYNQFMDGKSYILLNLCKPDKFPALASSRINKLLSHKCIIISEHTNEIDEALYKDLLYFCDITEISGLYEKLTHTPRKELQEIANRFYDLFKQRFCIENAIKLIECK